ncbi:MAG: flavodoxin family protein [Bacteroidales bacterium]|nr:flavodoxin family protein [Bacteroidales bacterium]
MKVVAINGSPRKGGNTAYAIALVGEILRKEGIEYEEIQIGGMAIRGCLACNTCSTVKNEKCAITTDILNDTLPNMKDADGIVIASPVYYSGIAGTMKCFLDRAFYVAASNGGWFRHKVGMSIVAVRRTGGSLVFSGLNQYLTIAEMLVPASTYWNVIHGQKPGDAVGDEEGIQTLKTLAANMVWMLKMREQSKAIEPQQTKKVFTNFIR